MDNVVINITESPNQISFQITEDTDNVTINVTEGYFTCSDLNGCQVITDLQTDLSAHISDTGNPHNVTASQVGLGNVDNTSDADKPVSTAQATAIGIVQSDINTHEGLTNNPHQVSLEQARTQNSSISGDINANSNTIINLKDAVNAQEPITKMQFDTYVSAVGGQRGSIDCSLNPNYPASNKGDRWEVTVAGKIGGASGVVVSVYDEIVCKVNSVAGDQATVGANFYIVQGNLERATETTSGYIQLATDIEAQAGIDNEKAVTSLKLANWWTWIKTQAQTFAAKITFTTAPRFNSTTANQRLEVDANKDLISVAKGTADNKNFGENIGDVMPGEEILRMKSPFFNTVLIDQTGTGHIYTQVIPAGILKAGNIFRVQFKLLRISGTGTAFTRIYCNGVRVAQNSSTSAGATQVVTRNYRIHTNGLAMTFVSGAIAFASDETVNTNTANESSMAIDVNTPLTWSVYVRPSVGTDIFRLHYVYSQIIRP